MYRYRQESELAVIGKILLSLVTSAPAGGAIVGLGNTAVILARLPETIWNTYRAIVKTPKIGPVLKTTVALVLPIAIVALPTDRSLGLDHCRSGIWILEGR